MRAATTLMTASAFDAPPRPLAGGLGPSPPRRRPRTGVAPPPPPPPPPSAAAAGCVRAPRGFLPPTRDDGGCCVLRRVRIIGGSSSARANGRGRDGVVVFGGGVFGGFLSSPSPGARASAASASSPPGSARHCRFLPAHGPSLEDGRGVPVVPSNLVHLSPDGATPRRGDGGGPRGDVLLAHQIRAEVDVRRIRALAVPDEHGLIAERAEGLLVLTQQSVQAHPRDGTLEIVQRGRGFILPVLRRAPQMIEMSPIELSEHLSRDVPARAHGVANRLIPAREFSRQVARVRICPVVGSSPASAAATAAPASTTPPTAPAPPGATALPIRAPGALLLNHPLEGTGRDAMFNARHAVIVHEEMVHGRALVHERTHARSQHRPAAAGNNRERVRQRGDRVAVEVGDGGARTIAQRVKRGVVTQGQVLEIRQVDRGRRDRGSAPEVGGFRSRRRRRRRTRG